jgi:hypothetical protein
MAKSRTDERSDKQGTRLHELGGGGVRSVTPAPPPTRLDEWALLWPRMCSCAACSSPVAEPSSVPASPDAWRSQVALERVNPPRWLGLTISGTPDCESSLIIPSTVSFGGP